MNCVNTHIIFTPVVFILCRKSTGAQKMSYTLKILGILKKILICCETKTSKTAYLREMKQGKNILT